MPSPEVKKKTKIMMKKGRENKRHKMQTPEIPNDPRWFILKLIHLLNQQSKFCWLNLCKEIKDLDNLEEGGKRKRLW